jgi:5'-3' exoribonuclease 2
MHDLAQALRGYILDRTNNHPLWAGRTVIFSDAFVPGEGEHKLLHFVRSQRLQPGYNDNTSHCIYGADADLIMLGLSTHEAHFYIIREIVPNPDNKTCFKCKRPGHFASECVATPEEIAKDKLNAVVDF